MNWWTGVMLKLSCISPVALLLSIAASAQQVPIGGGSVVEAVTKLKPGQYIWAAQVAPRGPMLLIVNTSTQRAVLFRNGVPIAASTVSTGRPGYRTPTGIFTVLQKHVEHYSSKYDNAPMPYMQRLTWYGIALHAGNLPGFPASHGCIRLPAGFAKLLYQATSLGMTVVITDKATQPRLAPAPDFAAAPSAVSAGSVEWEPGRSPTGPVSIIVSAADGRAVVLRNGVIIGSAPVTIEGSVPGTVAYALKTIDTGGHHWVRVTLSGEQTAEAVPESEFQRYATDPDFRRNVGNILQPGTTVVITPDSLRSGAVAQPVTLIEAERKLR